MLVSYIGNFNVFFTTETQIALTLEDMGITVNRIQEDTLKPEEVLDRVGTPDFMLFQKTWDNAVKHEHLAELKKRGIPTVSVHLDLFAPLARKSQLDTSPFWATAFIFSPDNDPKSQELFKQKGVNHFYLKPGVYKGDCFEGDYKPELAHDVTFVGGGLTYGHREYPYRRQLALWLKNTYGDRYGKYGHPEPTMRGKDLNDLFKSAKVVVGDSLCIDFKHTYYWSDRCYLTLGAKGFIIHPYIVGMEEEFTDGENIVFYKFGDFKELKDKIDYYISHDAEREKIRDAGHEFVKNNCTYHNRMTTMLEVLRQEGAIK